MFPPPPQRGENEKGGEAALEALSRQRLNPKDRVDESIEMVVVELAYEEQAWGQPRVANELAKTGMKVSASGVRGPGKAASSRR